MEAIDDTGRRRMRLDVRLRLAAAHRLARYEVALRGLRGTRMLQIPDSCVTHRRPGGR
ncbi:hypothetical protein [Anaeromyxobacter oryzisoli]|uniref:hypothetical protein n=1 Tax=Anaeromyxobacter oryzisoli TaxID=2925408 RepID=UPI001F586D8C|nr:hypothetical protein [Anaeromyxobacter sp. SG63]